MTDTVYYLTGRGGQLKAGVGKGVLDRRVSLAGRAMSGQFEKLEFQSQVDLISQDLQESFWQEDSKLIAVSYGAYLLLHALSDKTPFPGSILLLSPVMGGVFDAESMYYFSPPRPKKLAELSGSSKFPKPSNIETHVGENDCQSSVQMIIDFSIAVEGKYTIVKDKGHTLGKEYVGSILDSWL